MLLSNPRQVDRTPIAYMLVQIYVNMTKDQISSLAKTLTPASAPLRLVTKAFTNNTPEHSTLALPVGTRTRQAGGMDINNRMARAHIQWNKHKANVFIRHLHTCLSRHGACLCCQPATGPQESLPFLAQPTRWPDEETNHVAYRG
jgi:hypothetical protein